MRQSLLLGTSTDTQDITGRVLSEHSLDDPELPDGAVTEEKRNHAFADLSVSMIRFRRCILL